MEVRDSQGKQRLSSLLQVVLYDNIFEFALASHSSLAFFPASIVKKSDLLDRDADNMAVRCVSTV